MTNPVNSHFRRGDVDGPSRFTVPKGVTLLASVLALALAAEPGVFFEALLGTPEPVATGGLLGEPGLHVGKAVRVRGQLARREGRLEIAAPGGRLSLRLEPEAAGLLAGQGQGWLGQEVEVDGFFHRQAEEEGGAHALRAWRIAATRPGSDTTAPDTSVPLVTLEALVYGKGRHDGQLVRVRGVARGRNLHQDLPVATRRSAHDWVLKDGHFAAWIAGRQPAADQPVEVVGIPTTSRGAVRLAARAVAPAEVITQVVSRAMPTGDAGWAAVPPRVSFAFPAGEPLGPRGHMLLQFSKPMDPTRFARAVRVRYGDGRTPEVQLTYRDRNRALVITPATPPPPDSEVVVELLEGLVDVNGRALLGDDPAEGVVARLTFRTRGTENAVGGTGGAEARRRITGASALQQE